MKIVKVKDKRRHGIKAITEVGSVHPSHEDGTFHLPEELADLLIKGDDSFCYAEDYCEEESKSVPVEAIKPKSKQDDFVDLDADEIAELEAIKKESELQLSQLQPTTINEQIQKAADDHLNIAGSAPDLIEDENIENPATIDETEETKQYRVVLTSKTKAELTELAKAFPGGEWRALQKEPLIEYLIGKTK